MSTHPLQDRMGFITAKAMPLCSPKAHSMNRTPLFIPLTQSGGHVISLLVTVYSACPSVVAMLWRCGRIVQKSLVPLPQSRPPPQCVVGWGDFQLITWSKDKTLRFWPIDKDVLQVCFFSSQGTELFNSCD